jgi:site-specific recombinase XerD
MTEKHTNALIKEFEQSMKSSGLAKKTIKNHLQNVELFVIDYMLVEEIEFEEWPDEIDEFFDWAIRKNVVISQSSLLQFASSIKKLFKFLFDTGKINRETSMKVNSIFKEGMSDWKDSVQVEGDLYADEW